LGQVFSLVEEPCVFCQFTKYTEPLLKEGFGWRAGSSGAANEAEDVLVRRLSTDAKKECGIYSALP
jgi:hypothetical protein